MALARSSLERRTGWLLVAASIGLAIAAQVAGPVGVPLYDGVVVTEPYRYLHPAGQQAGEPTSFSSTPDVTGDQSPALVGATAENPPQAQLIAQEGAFVLPPGATGLQVSITPVDGPTPPAGTTIAGNAYVFSVTDQRGTPLEIRSACDGCMTLILRAPDGTESAAVKRVADGAWTDVEFDHAGAVDTYQIAPRALGTYAVLGEAAAPAEIDPMILIGGGAVALILIAGVLLFFKVKPATSAIAGTQRQSRDATPNRSAGRIPSKRKGGRRPPSGRIDR